MGKKFDGYFRLCSCGLLIPTHSKKTIAKHRQKGHVVTLRKEIPDERGKRRLKKALIETIKRLKV